MKKFLSVLLVASAIQLSVTPALKAAPLSEKIKTAQTASAKININTANQKQLESLPGIGAKKAKAIILYRNKSGKFASVDDLTLVKGIGEKMITKLQAAAIVK